MTLYKVKGPGGHLYKFDGPEDATDDELIEYAASLDDERVAHEAKTGIIPAAKQGLMEGKASAKRGISTIMDKLGMDEAAADWKQAAEADKAKAAGIAEPTTEADINAAREANGIVGALPKQFEHYVGEPLGGIAGRFGPTMAMSSMGPVGVAAALGNEYVASTGELSERGAEPGTALAGALPLAALNTVGYGKPVMGAIAKGASKVIPGTGYASRAAAGTLGNAAAMTPVMVTHEALSRKLADQQPLTADEALDIAKQGAILAPFFGAAHGLHKPMPEVPPVAENALKVDELTPDEEAPTVKTKAEQTALNKQRREERVARTAEKQALKEAIIAEPDVAKRTALKYAHTYFDDPTAPAWDELHPTAQQHLLDSEGGPNANKIKLNKHALTEATRLHTEATAAPEAPPETGASEPASEAANESVIAWETANPDLTWGSLSETERAVIFHKLKHNVPLQDAGAAVRQMRQRASEPKDAAETAGPAAEPVTPPVVEPTPPPEPEAVNTAAWGRRIDAIKQLVDQIDAALAKPGLADRLSTPAALKKAAMDLGVYDQSHKPGQALEAVRKTVNEPVAPPAAEVAPAAVEPTTAAAEAAPAKPVVNARSKIDATPEPDAADSRVDDFKASWDRTHPDLVWGTLAPQEQMQVVKGLTAGEGVAKIGERLRQARALKAEPKVEAPAELSLPEQIAAIDARLVELDANPSTAADRTHSKLTKQRRELQAQLDKVQAPAEAVTPPPDLNEANAEEAWRAANEPDTTGTPDDAHIYEYPNILKEALNKAKSAVDVPEQVRVNVRKTLSKTHAQHEAGLISEQEAMAEVRRVVDRLDKQQEAAAERRRIAGRRRGAEWIVAKVRRAVADGEMSKAHADFVQWLLDKSPHLAEELGISLSSKDPSGVSGAYNPVGRILKLFTDANNDQTGVHEILHHVERMLPESIRKGLIGAWQKEFDAVYAKADETTRAHLDDMRQMGSNPDANARVLQAFAKGELNYDQHYHLANPSEYWAVNGTRILAGRFGNQAWARRAAQWFKELLQHVKAVLGLKSDAPVLKALREALKAENDGAFIAKKMLQEEVGRSRKVTVAFNIDPDVEKLLNSKWTVERGEDVKKSWKDKFESGMKSWVNMYHGMTTKLAPHLPEMLSSGKLRADLMFRSYAQLHNTISTGIAEGVPVDNGDGTVRIETIPYKLANGKTVNASLKNMLAQADKLGPSGRNVIQKVMFVLDTREQLTRDPKKVGSHITKDMKAFNEAEATVAKLRKQHPEINDVLGMWRKINSKLIDLEHDSGLIDSDLRDFFKKNVDYAPKYMLKEDVISRRGVEEGKVQIGNTITKIFHEREASTHPVNIWENLAKHYTGVTLGAAANMAKRGAAEQFVAVGAAKRAPRIHYTGSQGDMAVMVNGKRQFFKFDDTTDVPSLMEMQAELGPFMKAAQGATQALRLGALSNPTYWYRQILRDPIQASLTSNLGWVTPAHTLMEMANILIGRSPGYKALKAAGVLGHVDPTHDVRSMREFTANIGREAREKGLPAKTATMAKNMLESVHIAVDGATRVAVYKAALAKALKQGKSATDAKNFAVMKARESINFAVKGSSPNMRTARALVPFLSASINGLELVRAAVTGRNFPMAERAEARRQFYSKVATLGMLSAGYTLLMSGDPDYEDVEDVRRYNNWLLPTGDKDHSFTAIPLPQELAFIKWLPEMIVRSTMGTQSNQHLLNTATTLVGNMIPGLVPQVLKPGVEVATNHVFYTGDPILTRGDQSLPKVAQGAGSASKTATLLAEQSDKLIKAMGGQGTPLGPKEWDHLFRGYGAELGRAAVAAIDWFLPDEVEPPEKDWVDTPGLGLKGIFGAKGSSQIKTDFYDKREEYDQLRNLANKYKAAGDRDAYRELLADPETKRKIQIAPLLDKYSRAMTALNNQARRIKASNISSELKTQRMEAIAEKVNALAKKAEAARRKLEGEVD